MHPHHMSLHGDSGSTDGKSSAGIPIPPSKPKIWSLADTAVCKTPPPSQHGGHQQHQLQQGGQQQSQHQQSYQEALQSPQYGMQASGNNTASAGSTPASTWGPANFSQFVDPAMMRLRHPNMLGMGYMAAAGLQQQSAAFTGQHAAAAAAAAAAAHAAAASQLPSGSPGLDGSAGGLQSNDTPPHTPPTANSGSKLGLTNGGQFGYNSGAGLPNGYSQMSPSSGPESAASKVLMFNSPINNSFKMI